jgi:hypothetical protein
VTSIFEVRELQWEDPEAAGAPTQIDMPNGEVPLARVEGSPGSIVGSTGKSLNRLACIEVLVQADDAIHPDSSTIKPAMGQPL